MGALDEETLQVADVDVLVVPVVDGLERLLKREIVGVLYHALHLVGLQLEPYFLVKQLAQRPLNPTGQEFTAGHLVVGSLRSGCSEKGIVTGQEYLQEVMVV